MIKNRKKFIISFSIILFSTVLCSCSKIMSYDGAEVSTPAPVSFEEEIEQNSIPEENSEKVYRDKLIINELMSYNDIFPNGQGEYYDWIELKNISGQELNLSDYYLSDDEHDRAKYQLPNQKLDDGELIVIWCDDNCFSIGQDENIYIFDSNEYIQDVVDASNIRYSFSRGTDESTLKQVTYTVPTPGEENGDGYSEESSVPILIGSDGVFNDVSSVTVELFGSGIIRYTLDGSFPTLDSEIYTKPFSVSETTVVRAVNYESGKLFSESLDLSYIINENHSLPVTSLVMEPDAFDGPKHGFYNHALTDGLEKPCSVKYFDGDDGFYIKCGVKLHGATSKLAQPKKSLKFKFRDVYDGDLNYNLFNNGVTEFSSVILRSAQESHETSYIRDILFHELAQQCDPNLSTQDYKFSILYINGNYWGIYAYREAHSEKHYAEHSEYSKSDISMYEAEWPNYGEFDQYFAYCLNHSMTNNEYYHHVADRIDLDSLITWTLIEGYSGNIDVHPHNVRFYYTHSDKTLHFALLDLDLGGVSTSMLPLDTGYDYSLLLGNLIVNDEFRAKFLEKAHEYLTGPLKDENLFALRDSLTSEIIDEIPRDAERWDYEFKFWKQEVDSIMVANQGDVSIAKHFAYTIKAAMHLTNEEYEKYLSDIE